MSGKALLVAMALSLVAPDASASTVSDDFSTDSGLWTYAGAYRDPVNGWIVLTQPDWYMSVGQVWLASGRTGPFRATFRYRIGGGSWPADGLVFMFNKQTGYAADVGGTLGFTLPPHASLLPVPGYGVEVDTYDNGWEPTAAWHIALVKDTVANGLAWADDTWTIDGGWHAVEVTVEEAAVTVSVDGLERFHWTGPIDRTFSGLGFSGATGAGTNWHLIDDVRIEDLSPACFESCAAIKASSPVAADGHYELTVSDMKFQVYCHDMAGTPREYLDVPAGAGRNFSQYTAGGASPGTDVRTVYSRIRLDPATLKVDIGDRTFASSTGALCHAQTSCPPPSVTFLEYATAMDCFGSGSTRGLANVDLTGTPFAVVDTFVANGFYPGGSASVSADGKVADLTGGGYCGWVSAGLGYHPVGGSGNFALGLRYVGPRYATACGADADGDGRLDGADNCPAAANPDQADLDGDGAGDVCDPCPADAADDADGDGICGDVDTCPSVADPNQLDLDGDGAGDACDPDDDGDGVADAADNCPLASNPDQRDLDGDGAGDVCDLDDDGDGLLDADDSCLGTAPGATVDASGCSIADLCPCASAWKNHGAHVSCVARTSEAFLAAGLISAAEKDATVSAAAASSCGVKN